MIDHLFDEDYSWEDSIRFFFIEMEIYNSEIEPTKQDPKENPEERNLL